MKKDPFAFEFDVQKIKSKKALDWEESAVDTLSSVEGFAQTGEISQQRWLKTLLILFFLTITARMAYLQGVQGKTYREFAENNRLRSQVILAPRGLIKDREGQILARNVASFNLVAVPFDMDKQNLTLQLQGLSLLVKFDRVAAEKKILTANPASTDPVIVKQDITLEESILFETRASEFIGFSVQKIPVRDYIFPESLFHVLGYAGLVTAEDLSVLDRNLYSNIDFIGKAGIEQMYENYLRGENGSTKIEVDAKGNLLSKLGTEEPESGDTLVLNLDMDLQALLYTLLKDQPAGKRRVAAVAMNPKTGEVLSLLSLPGLDGAKFMRGFSNEEYQKVLSDPSLPLFNRALQGTYPPGSTVKPMVAAAALQEGVIDKQTKYEDTGVLVIPNQYDPSIDYNFYGWKREGLGIVDVKQAIAKSSDIFFYIVSGGYDKLGLPGLGIDKLSEYYRKFNLGNVTGIDLPGEKQGLVPDPAWKKENFKDDPILSRWYLGDTYHAGIGQGDLLATPLQVAFWTATIANRGIGMQPQVLNKILKQGSGQVIFEQKPQPLFERFIDLKNIRLVQEGMRETVLSGSGRLLNTLPISAAGKTGTSQFDGSDPKKTHAWFTAYAPFEDPEIVITVLVEAGGEGSSVSVPVVKEALKWWAENRYKRNP